MRPLRLSLAIAIILGVTASAAQANTTLFVAAGGSDNSNNCQGATAPCATLSHAVSQAASVPDTVTIQVGAGTFVGDVALTLFETGITINGAGTGATVIQGDNTAPAVDAGTVGAVQFSNLTITNPTANNSYPVVTSGPGADLTFTNVAIDDEETGGNAISDSGAAVTFSGGSLKTGNASGGATALVDSSSGAVTLTNTPVTVTGTGSGIQADGPVTISGAPVTLSNSSGGPAIQNSSNGAMTLTNVTVDEGAQAGGVITDGPLTISGGTVSLTNPNNGSPAIQANGSNQPTSIAASAVSSAGHGGGVTVEGQLTMSSDSIMLTNSGASQPAINSSASGVVTSLTSVTVVHAGTAPGVYADGPLSVSSSSFTLSNTNNSAPVVDSSASGAPTTLSGTTVQQAGNNSAVYADGPLGISGGSVTATNPNDSNPVVDAAGGNASASIGGATIAGAGTGPGVFADGLLTLAASSVTLTNASDNSNAVYSAASDGGTVTATTVNDAGTGSALYSTGSTNIADSAFQGNASGAPLIQLGDGGSGGHSDVIQRTSMTDRSAAQFALNAQNVNLILDSSLVAGGKGINFPVSATARALTVSGSTIDADLLGSRDGGFNSITASSQNSDAAHVVVEGSILVEAPAATQAGTTVINCTNTETPVTVQSSNGTINCGATGGNTFTSAVGSIFASPGVSYALNPSWSGVDSIPGGAITLPSGLTPSATDLLGNPRVLNGVGACTPGLQDKGAIELTGHAGVVPAPQIGIASAPAAGVPARFTASSNVAGSDTWSFSDGASGAGPSIAHTFASGGPAAAAVTVSAPGSCTGTASVGFDVLSKDTISALKLSPTSFKLPTSGKSPAVAARTTGGTIVTYTDSTAATTTFTVQLPGTGRVSGHSCVKATSHNKHAKHCTLYTSVRSFTRNDGAGAQRFRFTGRFSNGKLAAAKYRLQVVAANAAGTGAPVYANFTVKR
jgi:hypothetical protein